jgi:hypothetical protein
MNGAVHKSDTGANGLAGMAFPVNRSAATRFGKLDAVIIIAVLAGLIAFAGFLRFILAS